MAPRAQRKDKLTKVVDDRITVRCGSGTKGTARFEIWEDSQGTVVRYNLAFIHHLISQVDHGRVLGYDNAHGHHELHHMGQTSVVKFESFAATLAKFLADVDEFKMNN